MSRTWRRAGNYGETTGVRKCLAFFFMALSFKSHWLDDRGRGGKRLAQSVADLVTVVDHLDPLKSLFLTIISPLPSFLTKDAP